MAEIINIPTPKERNLFFTEQVDQASIGKLVQAIIAINDDDDYIEKVYNLHNLSYTRKPIKIWIDSYGGYVYQCFGLLSIMDKSKTPIHTIVTGAAMSCGFMILIHGHHRFGYPHATPMYHQVSSGAWGTVKDMEENIEETKRLQIKIEEMTLSKTKIKAKRLEKVYKTKLDWYMSAKEALDNGVIDEII